MVVKKGDVVTVISGDDKGKQGTVIKVITKTNRVVVEGVNVRTKHTKPRKAGEPGGLIKAEVAFHASKANVLCSKCGKGVRTKVDVKKDGTKVRVCAKCGEEIK